MVFSVAGRSGLFEQVSGFAGCRKDFIAGGNVRNEVGEFLAKAVGLDGIAVSYRLTYRGMSGDIVLRSCMTGKVIAF
ncbi:hypothetical protein GXB81_27780 [Paraburkholderia sp. Ac-20336]|uniref:hypothetical protein n=1 Tax=Burkholderiaceae TaxID=119060 RepID=UPI0014223857|nr:MULTISPECIES: hypothetical protein [Burkholderiaceae]MBN3806820.1 hypothetical protein [Paraburkholderia sp. Ac-20336]MBN3850344.1 hypothetical protein [Paraburkholderia sp. Ac-20342]NIF52723.1 hypothetical protein [Burkholderia sp. Ax-1724]